MSSHRFLRSTLVLALLAAAGCELMQPAGRSNRSRRDTSPEPTVPASRPRAGGGPSLSLSNASGGPGQRVDVSVTLRTGGASVAGTQNDLVFDPSQIAIQSATGGTPDCSANRALRKNGTAFSFLPKGCKPTLGAGCTTVRALVLSLNNVDPIPDGATLYTCKLQISPQAKPGAQRLSMTREGFSDPQGKEISGSATNGSVRVK